MPCRPRARGRSSRSTRSSRRRSTFCRTKRSAPSPGRDNVRADRWPGAQSAAPERLGASILGANELYGKLAAYKARLRAAHPGGKLFVLLPASGV
jgi:hypothetical protein